MNINDRVNIGFVLYRDLHRDIAGTDLSIQSAGSGGGIIINVLLIIGLGYNTKDSVFISYIFLMGGGLAATLASIKKKTPSGKSIIDYDLVMITLPMIMSGAIFGVI